MMSAYNNVACYPLGVTAPYRKPLKPQTAYRMFAICAAEGLQVNQATMNELIDRADGDVRCVLGQLM